MENPATAEVSSASNPADATPMVEPVNTPVITPAATIQSSPFQSLAPLTIKLERTNYPYWRSQALPALRAHDLEGYVLGTKSCPPQFVDNTIGGSIPGESRQLNLGYAMWRRTNQSILSWLLNSISESMFGHVINCLTSNELWVTLERLYTTSSKARILQLRFQLQSLKKGNLTIHDYILKMKNIADSLSAAGQLLSDDDLILYILGGLGHEYEAVVVNLTSRHDQVTLQEVQYMLQSQEIRLEQLNSAHGDSSIPAAHLATQMRRSFNISNQGHNQNQPSGGRSYNSRGRGRGRGRSNNNRPICQLCSKPGHIASKCYHRFDISFLAPGSSQSSGSQNSNNMHTNNDQQAFFTSSDAHADNSWYIDSGATNHTTSEPSNIQHKTDLKGSNVEGGSASGSA